MLLRWARIRRLERGRGRLPPTQQARPSLTQADLPCHPRKVTCSHLDLAFCWFHCSRRAIQSCQGRQYGGVDRREGGTGGRGRQAGRLPSQSQKSVILSHLGSIYWVFSRPDTPHRPSAHLQAEKEKRQPSRARRRPPCLTSTCSQSPARSILLALPRPLRRSRTSRRRTVPLLHSNLSVVPRD